MFLLFAEESGLLPADNELYARAYSPGPLQTADRSAWKLAPADLTKKRQLLADVHAKTKDLTRYANLLVGAALTSSGKGGLRRPAANGKRAAASDGARGLQRLVGGRVGSPARLGVRGRVDSSSRYTNDSYGRPVACRRPISQVRLADR